MDGIIGVAIALAVLAFIVWLIGKLISIALFLVIVIPIYIALFFYAVLQFIAMNTFIALDKLFYFGFDLPVIAVWAFWGLVIGAAIQGCREMKIYGRKGTGVLIAVAPVLLLTLVGAIKISTLSIANTKTGTKPVPLASDTSVPDSMVLIPAGEFEMGSDDGDPDESPVHTVYVDAFYMDKYEVTNAEFAAFLNNARGERYRMEPYAHHYMKHIKYVGGKYQVQLEYENHPVSDVSWKAAMAYAAWVGKRLPTEAEWEKAARGKLVRKHYPWGDTNDTKKANCDRYLYDRSRTTAVGSYSANGYGLYDMAGNASEWCLDEYDADFYANSPHKNPISGKPIASIVDNFMDKREQLSVSRGGSYSDNLSAARCANRTEGPSVAGFRCVKSVASADSD